MKRIKKFYIFGGLWHDNKNNNTYNTAKIIDTQTDYIFYTRFNYGYDAAYLDEAKNYIKDNLIKAGEDFIIINIGSAYYKKDKLINKWF